MKRQFPTPVTDGVNFFQSALSFLDKLSNSVSNESMISADSSTVLIAPSDGF